MIGQYNFTININVYWPIIGHLYYIKSFFKSKISFFIFIKISLTLKKIVFQKNIPYNVWGEYYYCVIKPLTPDKTASLQNICTLILNKDELLQSYQSFVEKKREWVGEKGREICCSQKKSILLEGIRLQVHYWQKN